MKLSAYLRLTDTTMQAFAARIGVSNPTVHRWCHGKAFPAWEKIPAIEAATDGAVTAEDFVPRPSMTPETPMQQEAVAHG